MRSREGLDPKLIAEMTPEELGRFLREMRYRRGLKQHEVAGRAGVHPSYLSHLEAGKRDLRRMNAQAVLSLMKAYGLDEGLVFEVIRYWGTGARSQGEEWEGEAISHVSRLEPLELPLVEAGAGSPAWDDAQETLLLYLPELKGKGGRVFGVRIRGDSMEPLLYEGDIAVVWTEGGFGPGTVVAIGIPGNGIVVKQLYYGPEGEMLMHSVNPSYPDEPFPEGAKIWGPVIQIVRTLPGGKPGRHLLP